MEEYLADFERLSLKYSLQKVAAALNELRIDPEQKFFPRPDEVAARIEAAQPGVYAAAEAEGKRRREREAAYSAKVFSPEEVAWRRERFGYDPLTEPSQEVTHAEA